MTARTFGRRGQGHEAEMARRREAFIASERARREQLQNAPREEPGTVKTAAGVMPTGPVFVREKSMPAAYCLWFFSGGVGAHRFYLGFPASGAIQAGLWVFGWLMILAGEWWLWPVPILAGLWVLADAFLIPSLHREANARIRGRAVQYVFT